MKKILYFTLILSISLLSFSSCWISPEYKDYEEENGVYFFHDYDTMKSVIIPKINSSFSAWHWNNETFDEKYKQYKGNISKNYTDLSNMNQTDYTFAVRNQQSKSKIKTKSGQIIVSEYFWITSKYDDPVIFFQN